MAERALFIGFGQPVRGREERAVEVFNEFVGMFGQMQSDGRIESMDVTLLDPHGGDLGGFFMVHGSKAQCGALTMDEEFRRATIDAESHRRELWRRARGQRRSGRERDGDVQRGHSEGRTGRTRARTRAQRQLSRSPGALRRPRTTDASAATTVAFRACRFLFRLPPAKGQPASFPCESATPAVFGSDQRGLFV